MARVSLLRREEVREDAREMFDVATNYGPFGNQVAVMAHRPPILNNMFRMFLEIRQEQVLPRRILEIALVGTSLLNRCTYCVSHHTPFLIVEGMSEDGVARLADYRDHPELSEAERLVMELADEMTFRPHQIRDALFVRLKQHFSEAQLVELTFRIGLTIGVNRFNDALQIDLEDGVTAIPQV
jgi:uncharacterized peroxidase-related enzyme